MFMTVNDQVLDWDLDFLESITGLLDQKLEEIDRRTQASSDPDGTGIYDQMEGIYGLGFVACQQYLASVFGTFKIKKPMALAADRQLLSGLTVVQAVNHAANFWKHHDEWFETADTKQTASTKNALERVGVDPEGNYVSSCVLAALVPKPIRFKGLLVDLAGWRDSLRNRSRDLEDDNRPTHGGDHEGAL